MRPRTLIPAVCSLLAMLSLAYAADVNGKWTAQVPGRNGETRETTFTLKAEGGQLTGTMSGMGGDAPIADGKITGDDLSFKVVRSFNGNEITLQFKGKIAGDEIKFTRTREGGNQPPQEFTAKRSK
jgi:hypothetical protein